jgi:hypothetical protein
VLDSPAVDFLQRLNWYDSAVELGELFILKKNRRQAVCKLRSHQFGWELLLFIGRNEIVETQVCRSQDERRPEPRIGTLSSDAPIGPTVRAAGAEWSVSKSTAARRLASESHMK